MDAPECCGLLYEFQSELFNRFGGQSNFHRKFFVHFGTLQLQTMRFSQRSVDSFIPFGACAFWYLLLGEKPTEDTVGADFDLRPCR